MPYPNSQLGAATDFNIEYTGLVKKKKKKWKKTEDVRQFMFYITKKKNKTKKQIINSSVTGIFSVIATGQ